MQRRVTCSCSAHFPVLTIVNSDTAVVPCVTTGCVTLRSIVGGSCNHRVTSTALIDKGRAVLILWMDWFSVDLLPSTVFLCFLYTSVAEDAGEKPPRLHSKKGCWVWHLFAGSVQARRRNVFMSWVDCARCEAACLDA